jgi:hypothetical protein
VFDGTTDPTILETLACREAMVLANNLGWQRFFVALDCQGVVEDIDQSSGGLHGATLQDISECKTGFHFCKFIYERRNFNFEAHNLAKFVCNIDIGRHI